jgi:hypothetical protein
MKRSQLCTDLSSSIHRQLNMYALVANAAGVGVLAVGQSAEAKIIYTPTHHVIRERTSYHLDLNQDKQIDFTIVNSIICNSSACSYTLALNPATGDAAIGHHSGSALFPVASALKPGTRIGPDANFPKGLEDMAVGIDACTQGWCTLWGPWVNAQRHYLGLRFKIKGQTHYGWARLSVRITTYHFAVVLTGYAYESVPGKPIVAGMTKGPGYAEPAASKTNAPKPATLGMLALGSPGLSIWRRE